MPAVRVLGVAAAAEQRVVAERLLGGQIARLEIERTIVAERCDAIRRLTASLERRVGAVGTNL
jgi:hypothetical protein